MTNFTKALEVSEGAKQRGLCREGVLVVRRASKRVATKHNGASNDFLKRKNAVLSSTAFLKL
ncbi:MAG: hypothetical protein IJX10_02565 [Phascolarctobacterium sp.]|nr:hypothetical protein [Phascolarctobacterium sp.]